MRLATPLSLRLMFASVLAAVTASFVLVVPAQAATPQAPGSFTGYGFDTCVAPNQSVMDAWNLYSPYRAVGIYISGNSRYCGDEHQPNLSKAWVSANAAKGWKFMPIHVGRQAPCFNNNAASRVQKRHMSTSVKTARSQARAEAKETIAALKKFGFPRKSVSYLDIEWYPRTSKCDRIVLEFVDAWTEYLHAKGYKSGLYSSGSAAIQLVDEARLAKRKGFTLPDHMWNAWTNKKANTAGGPFMSPTGWTKHQRIHQYHNNVTVTHGKQSLTIDKNFLDVGKGSVAGKQSLPCKVPLSFKRYPQLKLGSKGPEVAALECLLKAQGLVKTVNQSFGTGTVVAIDAYRARLGLAPSGRTSKATWTALLASGKSPTVLKYGSVGQPVWRLQRALIAAGLKPALTGIYDAKTVKAVTAYRKARSLPAYPTTEAGLWVELKRGKTA